MHWCLQRLTQLKKRAYLARYLMPVEVPPDFMQDQALIDLHESYVEMQVGSWKAYAGKQTIKRSFLRSPLFFINTTVRCSGGGGGGRHVGGGACRCCRNVKKLTETALHYPKN